jgi:hypothetical protein
MGRARRRPLNAVGPSQRTLCQHVKLKFIVMSKPHMQNADPATPSRATCHLPPISYAAQAPASAAVTRAPTGFADVVKIAANMTIQLLVLDEVWPPPPPPPPRDRRPPPPLL